jgi:peptidoglycan/xylan/chitin deacetylase (PgdA/CDA1 family)
MIGPLVKYSTPRSSLRRILTRVLAVAEPLSVGDFVEKQRGGTLPKRFVVVTFDDGYRDTLEIAEPLLAELGVPFTIFLTTGFLDREIPPVEIELGRHFEGRLAVTKWNPLNHALAVLSGRMKRMSAEYESQRRALKGASVDERARALHSLADHRVDDECDLFLSWEEARALARSPLVTIGAHGHAHLDLTAATAAVAESEVSTSRRRIMEELDTTPEFYCFAYGAATEQHLSIVERAGFRAAFGIGTEVVDPADLDPYRIPRIDLSDLDSLKRGLTRLESP